MKALETLGWPVFQGVFSTLLGVLVMGTVDAYLISTFFKTVVLVILFGLLHSLVFLPVALTIFVRGSVNMCRDTCRKRERQNMELSGTTGLPATICNKVYDDGPKKELDETVKEKLWRKFRLKEMEKIFWKFMTYTYYFVLINQFEFYLVRFFCE